jgi:hypothetical protein
MFVE